MSSIATSPCHRTASPPRRPRSSPHARQTRRSRHRDRKRHRRQTRQARAARRKLQQIHQQLPQPARSLFEALAGGFTRPTFLRFLVLALASLLTLGRRTVCNLLRTLGALAPGHPSSYHRLFSQRRWSSWRLARGLAGWVFDHLVPDGRVLLAGDDTVDEHKGAKVFGKGCHRDPVRSTHSFTAFRWGHKWVVLAVLVRFPFATRPWALPLLVALYRPEDQDRRGQRRHKTPPQLLRPMLRVLVRWFPGRTFVGTADGNDASHELAELAARYPTRLTYVSKFYPNANLVAPPPPYSGQGRPRVKGDDLPDPAAVVRDAPARPTLEVAWYGGGRRRVAVVTGTGLWYQGGRPLVPVRRVFVHDLTGTHRDESFFTTDPVMSPATVIETYTGRWNIETTFQEVRSYLGLETTRGRGRETVRRVGPCLCGLYKGGGRLYADLPARFRRLCAVDCPRPGGVALTG